MNGAGAPVSGARALRDRLYPPRRVHVQRSGWLFGLGVVTVGMAAVVSGNNLLFLLLGAMAGFVVLSGGMSEAMLRGVEVRRRAPRRVTVGLPARITYELHNRKRWLPSLALEVGEAGWEGRAFIALAEPGVRVVVRGTETFEQRGVYPLQGVTVATSFPFGMFHKERDLVLAGEIVVWPRTDHTVREVRRTGSPARRQHSGVPSPGSARGEFRSLRDYRPGDDPRDVHWRSSARRTAPVIRQYERSDSPAHWLCLDLRATEGPAAERAVETVAALAARAARGGEPFGMALPGAHVPPGTGSAHLERVLDLLARVRFSPEAPALQPPAPGAECVLVTASLPVPGEWADTLCTAGGAA